jgi:DNA invertase Pin-like site-specific DNA recombinase|tara:strand:+ start:580 stop:1218 length:639 start_codon:yes stop_codon:yes gene_type:complete
MKKNYLLYARCSSKSQRTTSQKRTLKEAYPDGEIFEEKLSGVSKRRPERERMLEQLDENSVIVCTRMSRLSRSLSDMFSVMSLIRSKKSDVIFIHENIDTTTSHGRLVFGLMNVINSYQRELIADSVAEGRRAKEAQEGFDRWGRPDKFTPEQKQHVRDLRKQNKSYNDIVKLTGISRASVYLILKPKKRKQFNNALREARNQKKADETLKT